MLIEIDGNRVASKMFEVLLKHLQKQNVRLSHEFRKDKNLPVQQMFKTLQKGVRRNN